VAVIFVLYLASGVISRLRTDRRPATTGDRPTAVEPVEVA
jgi:hypothetical protein